MHRFLRYLGQYHRNQASRNHCTRQSTSQCLLSITGIRRDGYQLIPVEKAVRDRLGEIGWPVSRKHVGWILHGLLSTGCDLGNEKTLTAVTLADTFELFVLSLVASSGLELTAEEISLVDQWIEPSHRPQQPAQNADA